MRSYSKSLIVAAALAAVPAAANAVVVTYSIDPNDFFMSALRAGPYVPVPAVDITGNGAATTVTLPVTDAGFFVKFGVDAQLSNLTSGTASSSNPATGLAQFSFGATDANPSIAIITAGKNSNASGATLASPVINAIFSSATNNGQSDGNGGILNPAATTTGINPATAANKNFNVGTSGPQELASSIEIANLQTGSAKFTITPYLAGTQYVTVKPGSTAGTSSAQYGANTLSGTDSAAAAPTLTLVVGGTVTTGPTHSIISLTPGTTVVPGYTPADGTIAMTGKGFGSYNVTTAANFTTATTGSVLVSGFNPSTDKEIYALKLSQNGTAISPTNSTLLSAIAADINGGNGNLPPTGVSASLISGVFANLFPGYDLLLTSTGVTPADLGGNAVLGFDFSSAGEGNAADAGITVTGVAAVPEPATAAGVVIGAAGLLLGRRKRALAAA